MTRVTELHKKWLKSPEYRKAYDALEGEFRSTFAPPETLNSSHRQLPARRRGAAKRAGKAPRSQPTP